MACEIANFLRTLAASCGPLLHRRWLQIKLVPQKTATFRTALTFILKLDATEVRKPGELLGILAEQGVFIGAFQDGCRLHATSPWLKWSADPRNIVVLQQLTRLGLDLPILPPQPVHFSWMSRDIAGRCHQHWLISEAGPPKRYGSGLFIHVLSDGARLWCFACRFAGKQKLLSCWTGPMIRLLSSDDAYSVVVDRKVGGGP